MQRLFTATLAVLALTACRDMPPNESGVCWDLDSDAECDGAKEDLNGDGACDVLDCRGPQGAQGPQGKQGDPGEDGLHRLDGEDGDGGDDGAPGAAGMDGINCWDLNGNGLPDVPAEDFDGSGVVDVLDCVGPEGPQGPPGPPAPGGAGGVVWADASGAEIGPLHGYRGQMLYFDSSGYIWQVDIGNPRVTVKHFYRGSIDAEA
jgi:hypothetical protein